MGLEKKGGDGNICLNIVRFDSFEDVIEAGRE
jgi:hypothetical protein